jgi:hypothetical protein
MKVYWYGCLFVFIYFSSSCNKANDLRKASELYSQVETDSISYSLIRYLGKLPGKANHGTKFNVEFDEYYKTLAKSHNLIYYHQNQKDNYIYFLFTRIAPSLHEKKVAIGGKLKVENGSLVFYEEAFRTWKMPVNELNEKMELIFKDYVSGKDLSKYYTKNSNGVEYIEFPDDNNYFDTKNRIWVSSIDYMEPYYQLKSGVDTVKAKIDKEF